MPAQEKQLWLRTFCGPTIANLFGTSWITPMPIPLSFLGYFSFGIQQTVPGFGQAMFPYLQEAAGELSQHPERAVDVLLNEVLERVDQQLILVLDDYHHLGPTTAVHAVLDRLLTYLPDVMHVIIISREMPPISLARLPHSISAFDHRSFGFTFH